jgi:hypothetical protein
MPPVLLDPAAPDLSPWLRAGDGVVVAQAGAEPTALVEAAGAHARALGPRLQRPSAPGGETCRRTTSQAMRPAASSAGSAE